MERRHRDSSSSATLEEMEDDDRMRIIPPSPIHSPGVSPKSQPPSPSARDRVPSFRLTPSKRSSFQAAIDRGANGGSTADASTGDGDYELGGAGVGLGIANAGTGVDTLSVEHMPPSIGGRDASPTPRSRHPHQSQPHSQSQSRSHSRRRAGERAAKQSDYVRGGRALRREEELSTMLYTLRRAHRWSAYGFAGFALVHLLNTGVAVLISRPGLTTLASGPSLGGGGGGGGGGVIGGASGAAGYLTGFNGVLQPADDNLLSARALYHAWHPIVEVGLVAGSAAVHILSGVALRAIRLFREARLYRHRLSTLPSPDLEQSFSPVSPTDEFDASGQPAARAERTARKARVSLWSHLLSTLSWTSILGYLSIPLIGTHAYLQRVAPRALDVDASAGFVAHLLNLPTEGSALGGAAGGVASTAATASATATSASALSTAAMSSVSAASEVSTSAAMELGELSSRLAELKLVVRWCYPLLILIGGSHLIYGFFTLVRFPSAQLAARLGGSTRSGGGESDKQVRRIRLLITALVVGGWMAALGRLWALGPVVAGYRKLEFDRVVHWLVTPGATAAAGGP